MHAQRDVHFVLADVNHGGAAAGNTALHVPVHVKPHFITREGSMNYPLSLVRNPPHKAPPLQMGKVGGK